MYETKDEKCEEKIKEFIVDKLSIPDDITFDRVHRIGSSAATKPRPIVAKFHYHKQREQVRQKAYADRDTLKPLDLGVGAQFPKEIREARKLLYPVMKREERKGNTVRLAGDKLYINNRLYNADNDPEAME